MTLSLRNYYEFKQFYTFDERFDYLKLKGDVGAPTFGYDRYLNQRFYTSSEWRNVRQFVIARDLGCDLGVKGFEIYDKIIIHHMNPMTVDEISEGHSKILDPDFLITTTHKTHNAIHYGDRELLIPKVVPRAPGDTALW